MGTLSVAVTALSTVVQFCLQGELTGWAGIGFGPVHSDMHSYVGWITSSGRSVLQDGYSTSWSIPVTQSPSDARITSASQTGNTFRMCFTRPWDALVQPASDLFLAWAYHSNANPESLLSTASYMKHTHTSFQQVTVPAVTPTRSPTPSKTSKTPTNPPTNPPTSQSTDPPSETPVPSTPQPTIFSPLREIRGDENFYVSWSVQDSDVIFTYDCIVSGWVGLGFDLQSPIHTSTDTYISWIASTGAGMVHDGYSTAQTQPGLDNAQTANVTFVSFIDGRLRLQFSRPILSWDTRDVNLTDEVWVGWAYHPTLNPLSSNVHQAIFATHTAQGTKRVNFNTGEIQDYKEPYPPSTYYLLACVALFTVILLLHLVQTKRSTQLYPYDGFYRGSQFETYVQYALYSRVPHCRMSKIDLIVALLLIGLNLGAMGIGVYTGFSQAQIWGYLCAVNSFLVAVPATRNSILLWLLALPVDQTIQYHRWLGRLTIVEAFLHIVCSFDLPGFTWTHSNLYGLGAGLCLACIACTSVAFVRRRAFNFFFYTHHVFVVYYVLGALHSSVFLTYSYAAAAVYGFDRILRLFRGLYPRRITHAERLSDRIIKIRFPKQRWSTRHQCAGQYVFLNFPAISLLEWHPFTLADAPDDPEHAVYIKSLGDYTQKIMDYFGSTSEVSKTWIRVDGPYGHWRLHPGSTYSHVLFVCGGVGITPCLSYIRQIYAPTAATTSSCLRHLYLVWCCPTEEDARWVNQELVYALERSNNLDYPGFHLYIFITGQVNVVNPTFYAGRPDIDQVFDTMESRMVEGTRACVHVCGPKSLSETVWDTWTSRNAARKTEHPCEFRQEIFEF